MTIIKLFVLITLCNKRNFQDCILILIFNFTITDNVQLTVL